MSRLGLLKHGSAALALVATVLLAGCKTSDSGGGLVQGWDTAARDAWYNGDQGSRLMPLKWFQALEQPGSVAPKPFNDPAYLATFRILPPRPGASLPIGFAVDDSDDTNLVLTKLHWIANKPPSQDKVQWVGLNCAACHTAQMTYGGQTFTIDGAPSLFDFQSFVKAADDALTQTRDSGSPGGDGKRWDRFAHAVLGSSDDNPGNRALLMTALTKLVDLEARIDTLNKTDSHYGFGRLDAVGHIYNRVLVFGGAPQPTPNPTDAPVSYPHLWNITKQTQLQWDGIATNDKLNIGATPTDYGALGRNTGEVLGVFGEAVIKAPSGPLDVSGFVSSADIGSLNSMEVVLTKLQPPVWPAAFGTPGQIDVTDASGHKLTPAEVMQAGAALFTANCASCHTPHTTYETMRTFAQLGPENLTDEWMACNAWAYSGASGALAGIPVNYVSGTDKLAAVEPVRALLTTTVKGVLIGKKGELVGAAAANIFGVTPLPRVVAPKFARPVPLSPKDARLEYCMQNATDPLMAYKARPLEGIWATGPYLHNGSVPTLYDLLQPVAKRPMTFQVGTRVFDPKKVGYDTSASADGNSFTFDTTQPGNSNKGHVYGVGALTETQRLELLEYLKGLNTPTG